jgi:RNA ligase
MIEFKEFPKLPRLNRLMTITEKLDGTNSCVIIDDDFKTIAAQSRTRLITPQDDNYGFAKWVEKNKDELITGLGPGHHFGEWWGQGVNKRYPDTPKTFSLFNVARWRTNLFMTPALDTKKVYEEAFPDVADPPSCCSVVPFLYHGPFNTSIVDEVVEKLKKGSSFAAFGKKAEGIVVFHHAANSYFKVTLEKDDEWKGKSMQ